MRTAIILALMASLTGCSHTMKFEDSRWVGPAEAPSETEFERWSVVCTDRAKTQRPKSTYGRRHGRAFIDEVIYDGCMAERGWVRR